MARPAGFRLPDGDGARVGVEIMDLEAD
jgi:hypothetical protein